MRSRTSSSGGGVSPRALEFRSQDGLVVGADVVEADEDARPDPLLDVGENHQLPVHQAAQPFGVEVELDQPALESTLRRRAPPHSFDRAVDLRRRHFGETEAVDLVHPQTLLDQSVENTPAVVAIALSGRADLETQPHRAFDLGSEDGIAVDRSQDAVDELLSAGRHGTAAPNSTSSNRRAGNGEFEVDRSRRGIERDLAGRLVDRSHRQTAHPE